MATQDQPKDEETKQTNEQQNQPGSQQLQTQSAGRRPSQQTGMARRGQFGSSSSSSPFTFMRRFSEEMDRLFDDFGFGGSWLGSSYGRDFFPINLGEEFRQSLWSPQ